MDVKDFILNNRSFHFLMIDIILIIILIITFKYGDISDHSMPICLLGTYILSKSLLNFIHMKWHPFKCGLQLCI